MFTPKIPATIVTGFLGSGKTTLLSNLIRQAGEKRLALIVNEFGDLGFDGALLGHCGVPGCTEDDVIELTNGCICCTVADDFLPTIEKLLARDPAPEHILIETSGLALPQPLVQAFNWPGIKSRVSVDGVITVVDASALAAGRPAPAPAPDAGRLQAVWTGTDGRRIAARTRPGSARVTVELDVLADADTATLQNLVDWLGHRIASDTQDH